jgi:hypothetical protein
LIVMANLRRAKYGNRKVTTPDGLKFDSKREHGEWVKLEALARKGAICNLTRQVSYPLAVNGVTICRYVADFVWVERCDCHDHAADGRRVVADAKGYRTREYLIKKRLMRAIYGIEILEL